jgi:hypothetical protein
VQHGRRKCGSAPSLQSGNLRQLCGRPHLADEFKLSNDPMFAENVYGIVSLCLDAPEAAVVCRVILELAA